MQHLASLAVLLLVFAPVFSRAMERAGSVVDAPLCQSRSVPAELAPGSFFRSIDERRLGTFAAAVDALQSAKLDPQGGTAFHAESCDYCVLVARLLPWLLIGCVVFALARTRVRGERSVVAPVPSVRWWAHAPRGPPLRV